MPLDPGALSQSLVPDVGRTPLRTLARRGQPPPPAGGDDSISAFNSSVS